MAIRWKGLQWSRSKGSAPDPKAALESEPTRSEAGEPAPTPSESDRELLSFVEQRRGEARLALQQAMPEIVIGLAFEAGKQWFEWKQDRSGGGQLVDTRNKDDLKFYRSVNLIRPRVLTNVARATASRPDVALTPKSMRELDRRAAEEARVVVDHYEQVNNGRDQLRRIVHYNYCGTVAAILFWWDNDAWATVPDGAGTMLVESPPPDPLAGDSLQAPPPTPEPAGYVQRQVGELREKVVFGHQIFLDPRGCDLASARYVLIEEWLPLAEIEQRYKVKCEPDEGDDSPLRQASSEASAYLGGWWAQKVAPRAKKVHTYYERPSAKFKFGRTVVFTSDQILVRADELPCTRHDTGEPGVIPLVECGYQPRLDSPYHRNPVSDAAQPQYDFNILRSLALRQMRRAGKLIQSRRMDDMGGADVEEMVDEGPSIITLWHQVGSVPAEWKPIPPIGGEFFTFMAQCTSEINDILGVHSVSAGQGDPNAESGYAIRLLTDNDRTQQAPYMQALQTLVEQRAAMRIRFASHYVMEPRAWGLDDLDNPQDADGRVSGLPALRAGGAVAVKIVEATGTPATPEAMDEETMILFEKGALGDPALPQTQQLLLQLLHSPAATRAKELIERQAAEAPPIDPLMGGAPPPPGLDLTATPPPIDPNQDPLQPPMAIGQPGDPAPLALPPDLSGAPL